VISTSPTDSYVFREPGTYEIEFFFGSLSPPISATETYEYVVPFSPPIADFEPSLRDSGGPVDIRFEDRSLGAIVRWDWDFGDGSRCTYPASGGLEETCESASPVHTYSAIGRYDVSLTVVGAPENPGEPDLVDSLTLVDAVTVTILDPGFEAQTVGAEIAGGWSVLRPATAAAIAQHVSHGSGEPEGADADMPTDGTQWASLDGLGTDGSDPAGSVENGIEARFVLPFGRPVIEFDYVFLQSEPPAGFVRDAMTATVSDGVDTVEITSAAADSWSAYAGGSGRYPTLDGGTTRVTPLRTASLDVESAFPAAGSDTEYILTIRLTNDANGFRPPRAYVDHVRFVERAAPIVADFLAPATIVAGEPADFFDATCPDPAGSGCEGPTSWRWDFDTREAIAPPAATGSALQDPSYVFDEPGDYDVSLWARNADQESQAVMTVTVLEAPEAIPVVVSVVPNGPFWDVDVRSDSASDPADPITEWSWDFAGWATSSLEDPGPVEIRQAGIWTIRLTVKTSRQIVATGSVDVELN